MKKFLITLISGLLIGGVLIFLTTFLYGMFILPYLNKNVVCIQSLSRSCFLKTPICFDFPNPCVVPPLWFPR